MTAVADRLAERTEGLVRIPSESRSEAPILASIREQLPAPFEVVDDEDSVLLALPERRQGAPLVLLAGHVDTVPLGRSAPGRREEAIVHGRGAADMKGGLTVMLEIVDAIASGDIPSDLDLGLVVFGRESCPSQRARSCPCSNGVPRPGRLRSRW